MEWENIFKDVNLIKDKEIFAIISQTAKKTLQPDAYDSEDLALATVKCYQSFVDFKTDKFYLTEIQKIAKNYKPILSLYTVDNSAFMGVLFIKNN